MRNNPPPDTPVAKMRNLGPASATMLESIGVLTAADLERVGPLLAYRSLRKLHAGVSLNLLYAMHGALCGERWNELSPATRAALRRAAEEPDH